MRLARLDSQARQMLEAAAVLGFSFSSHELETMLAWSPTTYVAVLDDLQAQGLLCETTASGLDDYTFSHQVVHQITLNEIPPDRAVRLHEQAAHTLENVCAGRPGFAAEIASHYQAAQRPVEAARFWLVHARELTDLAAFEAAEAALARATALLGEGVRSHEHRELQAQAILQRGLLAHYRGQMSQALSYLENALG